MITFCDSMIAKMVSKKKRKKKLAASTGRDSKNVWGGEFLFWESFLRGGLASVSLPLKNFLKKETRR